MFLYFKILVLVSILIPKVVFVYKMSKFNKSNLERSPKRRKSKVMEVDENYMTEWYPSLVSVETKEDFDDEKNETTTCQICHDKLEPSKVESHFLNEHCLVTTGLNKEEAKAEGMTNERKKVTRSRKIEIINLRDKGWSVSKIAKFYEMADSSVRTIIKKRDQVEDQKESSKADSFRRKWLPLSQKIEIINKWNEGWRQAQIAKFYEMAESSVRQLIKQRDKYENFYYISPPSGDYDPKKISNAGGQIENTSSYINKVEKNVEYEKYEKPKRNKDENTTKDENIERPELELNEKLEILRKLEQGWKISEVAEYYDLIESSIKYVIRTKRYINFQYLLLKQQQNIILKPLYPNGTSDEVVAMEIQLHNWIKNFDKPLTENEIQSKADDLYNDILREKLANDEIVGKHFTANRHWLKGFKKRTRLNCKGERKILTLSQKLEIIDKSDEGWRPTKIAKFYNMGESSIRTIIKQRQQLEEQMVTAIGKKYALK